MPQPMLVIRREQLAALAAASRRGYVQTVAAYLREALPAQAGGDAAALEGRVRALIERAELLGLETEWELGRFCHLALVHGDTFDETCGWARRAFARKEAPPGKRLDAAWNHHTSYLVGA